MQRALVSLMTARGISAAAAAAAGGQPIRPAAASVLGVAASLPANRRDAAMRRHASSAASPALAETAAVEQQQPAPQILKFGVFGTGAATITKVTNYTKVHSVQIDEPVFLGGKDTAANPVELLLSSLVGCIQVTLHVIASESNVALDKVSWDANGDIDLRGFLGVQGVFPGFSRINVTATIATPASATQLEELRAKVLARCPVGNTIKAPNVNYSLEFVKAE